MCEGTHLHHHRTDHPTGRTELRPRTRAAGKIYDSSYVSRMKGAGLWADLLRQRFATTCRRLGLNRERVELDLTQFRPGLAQGQGSLF